MKIRKDYAPAYRIIRKKTPTKLENLGTACMTAIILAVLIYMFMRMFLPAVLP